MQDGTKKNLVYIRAILSVCILLAALYNYGSSAEETASAVLVYLAVLLLSNIAVALLPKKAFEGVNAVYAVFVMDIIFIGLAAFWLADFDHVFIAAVFLTIFICAVAKSVRLSLAAAVMVNIVYVFLKANYSEAGLDAVFEEGTVINIPLLFMVALHSGFLAERSGSELDEKHKLEKSNLSLSKQYKNMEERMEAALTQAGRVLDVLEDGVIAVDNGGNIMLYNRACAEIFGLPRSKAVNMPINVLKPLNPVYRAVMDANMKKEAVKGREASFECGNAERIVTIDVTLLTGAEGAANGAVCVIKLKKSGGENI